MLNTWNEKENSYLKDLNMSQQERDRDRERHNSLNIIIDMCKFVLRICTIFLSFKKGHRTFQLKTCRNEQCCNMASHRNDYYVTLMIIVTLVLS